MARWGQIAPSRENFDKAGAVYRPDLYAARSPISPTRRAPTPRSKARWRSRRLSARGGDHDARSRRIFRRAPFSILTPSRTISQVSTLEPPRPALAAVALRLRQRDGRRPTTRTSPVARVGGRLRRCGRGRSRGHKGGRVAAERGARLSRRLFRDAGDARGPAGAARALESLNG